MYSIISGVDGLDSYQCVCNATIWLAKQLDSKVLFVHILEKGEEKVVPNVSGNIGLGSREQLLNELIVADEKRNKLAIQYGKEVLSDCVNQARENGVLEVDSIQQHSELVAGFYDLSKVYDFAVIGRSGEKHQNMVGSHLEGIVRLVQKPILIANNTFTIPKQVLVAYDGSASGDKMIDFLVKNKFLNNVAFYLVMVSTNDNQRKKLQQATTRLKDAGFDVEGLFELNDDVASSISKVVEQQRIDLVIMGAYGHSRIRQLLVGSNTTKLIDQIKQSIIILR